MLRFASRLCRIGIPFGFVVWKTQTIFNKEEEAQNNHFDHSIASSFMKDIETAQSLAQSQEQTENKNTGNEETEQTIENNNQSSSETKLNNDDKLHVESSTSNKENTSENDTNIIQPIEEKEVPKLVVVASLPKNEAKVSKKTPKFLIEYLKMNNINVLFDESVGEEEIKVINSEGDQRSFPSNKSLLELGNFLNPPKIVESIESLKALLKSLPNDEYIISTYIPEEKDYKEEKRPKSEFDTFSSLQQFDINALLSSFRELKYDSASNKHTFVIVRDQEMARYLRMNTNKIGDKYVFYKTALFNGMEASALLEGEKYTIKTVPFNAPQNKNLIQTGIHALINEINIDGDMEDLLHSLKVKKETKKLMVIYSKERRPEFINPLKNVTLKVAKMMKDDVIVVMTSNEKLLSKYFQIIPDDFVTLRLVDTNRSQPPLFTLMGHNRENRLFYSRKIMEGAFNVENLCRFIKDGDKLKEYYERKKNLVTIPSIISQEEEIPNNTVILHWKNGCKACELTLSYMEQIQKILKSIDEPTKFKYEIEVPELMSKVQFRRFNILNESSKPNQEGHDVTPKVFMHCNGKMQDLEIGNIIGKLSEINVGNEDKIHEEIMKRILEEIRSHLSE